jgi:hypothetical protein
MGGLQIKLRIWELQRVLGFIRQWNFLSYSMYGEPGSVVGIATGYGLDGPGIESR